MPLPPTVVKGGVKVNLIERVTYLCHAPSIFMHATHSRRKTHKDAPAIEPQGTMIKGYMSDTHATGSKRNVLQHSAPYMERHRIL